LTKIDGEEVGGRGKAILAAVAGGLATRESRLTQSRKGGQTRREMKGIVNPKSPETESLEVELKGGAALRRAVNEAGKQYPTHNTPEGRTRGTMLENCNNAMTEGDAKKDLPAIGDTKRRQGCIATEGGREERNNRRKTARPGESRLPEELIQLVFRCFRKKGRRSGEKGHGSRWFLCDGLDKNTYIRERGNGLGRHTN